ncbi:MAG: succinate dehydrogenase flavoprotein subunit [Planctomycetes bacterium RBG_16_43_13]|nr:MAG: succinate dehydrogenase flavoprotein subunit [Planctomycetes bacterium RBG_16_43_13]
MSNHRVIVVGGGLAGLMTVIKIAEAGIGVDLFSMVPVKRSHSVCAQGGINGSVNTKGEGDSPEVHFYETVKGGDFLAHQPLAKGMCYAAPGIIYLLDRMGVMFNRTPEGLIDFRRFGGTLFHRTAFAGATTGQQMLYALDEQVRKYEVEGLVKKYETWEFLSAVIDSDGICRGITAIEMNNMKVEAFRADAVVLATGGVGAIFGKSTNSVICNGSAASAIYQQGVKYANGEFIQVHPTAIPGDDKLRLMSESARGEGGRVWTYRDGKPWYFLEEKYPRYGNLVPRDIASREIWHVVQELGLGVDGKPMVYLDVSHISRETLDRKLGGILEIYEKFVGDDPRKVPMKIFPAVHYTMGGIWVDYEKTAAGMVSINSTKNQMTNIPGLYAVGECDYQYHGANRLGANSLLSCVYAGMICGPSTVNYINGLKKSADDVPSATFDAEKSRQAAHFDHILRMVGHENPYNLHRELADEMSANVTIVRYNIKMKQTYNKIDDLMVRWRDITLPDKSPWANQSALFVHRLWNMLELARVVVAGAILRDECRGSHYKPDFVLDPDDPDFKKKWKQNNEKWLKTTIATWTPDGPKISYEPVDTSLIEPVPRKYD